MTPIGEAIAEKLGKEFSGTFDVLLADDGVA